MFLADGELVEGGFPRRFRLVVVLEINADDLVALEAEVALYCARMTCNLVLPWASTPWYSSANAIAGSGALCFCVEMDVMERFGGSAMDTCVVCG